MGCDIHLFVEKPSVSKRHNWIHVPAPKDWNAETLAFDGEAPSYSKGKWFWDRNYELFARLAGVRDYHENSALFAPRGLPDNVSPQVSRQAKEWGADGHTHTWLTLGEFDPGPAVKHSGFVDEPTYLKWRQSGEPCPNSWCQGMTGPKCTEAEYRANGAPKGSKPGPFGLGIFCEWEVPSEHNYARFIKFIAAVREKVSEKARLVLWFDN